MKQMDERHTAVLVYAGSYTTSPASLPTSSPVCICLNKEALTAPFSIGTSYVLPVLMTRVMRGGFAVDWPVLDSEGSHCVSFWLTTVARCAVR